MPSGKFSRALDTISDQIDLNFGSGSVSVRCVFSGCTTLMSPFAPILIFRVFCPLVMSRVFSGVCTAVPVPRTNSDRLFVGKIGVGVVDEIYLDLNRG